MQVSENGNGHKRAVLYARVSTDDQADKGYSLPSQLDAMRKYAERLGFSVVSELTEDISGAIPISERPEGKKLAAMLKARQADVIIAYCVDRLYRDNVELLIAVRMWLRAGVEVHTCDIGRIEDENNIILLIKGWQGSDERAKIRERCMRGKRAKAQAGKLIACRPPYGYAYVRDDKSQVITLFIDEPTARIVRLIYRWYVYGDENGRTLPVYAIAKRLSELGVPTPGELQTSRRVYQRTRPSGVWNEYTVFAILTEEAYAGTWHYNETIRATRQVRPQDEHIRIAVPAIVDRETWEHAQAQRKRNKALARRNAKRDYLLRGRIKCSCERSMCGRTNRGRSHYVCTSYHVGKSERKPHRSNARMEAIDADVWGEIEELFSDLDRLWVDLIRTQQEELDAQEPKRAELEAVEANIAETERKAAVLGRTLATLAETDPEGVVAKSMQPEVDRTNALHRGQVKRRDEITAQLGKRHLTDDAIAEIMQYARDVREGIQNADLHAKWRMLERLDVQVTIKEGRYYLKCVLGETEGEITKIDKRLKSAIVLGASR